MRWGTKWQYSPSHLHQLQIGSSTANQTDWTLHILYIKLPAKAYVLINWLITLSRENAFGVRLLFWNTKHNVVLQLTSKFQKSCKDNVPGRGQWILSSRTQCRLPHCKGPAISPSHMHRGWNLVVTLNLNPTYVIHEQGCFWVCQFLDGCYLMCPERSMALIAKRWRAAVQW